MDTGGEGEGQTNWEIRIDMDTLLCLVDSLQPCGLWTTRHLCPWGFSRQEYWSGWVHIFTTMCKIASAKPLCNPGSSAQCSVTTGRDGMGCGRETQEGGDTDTLMADFHFTAEINTAL